VFSSEHPETVADRSCTCPGALTVPESLRRPRCVDDCTGGRCAAGTRTALRRWSGVSVATLNMRVSTGAAGRLKS
jgi:hypothetical protein